MEYSEHVTFETEDGRFKCILAEAEVLRFIQTKGSVKAWEVVKVAYGEAVSPWLQAGYNLIKALNTSLRIQNEELTHDLVTYDIDQMGFVIDQDGSVALRTQEIRDAHREDGTIEA